MGLVKRAEGFGNTDFGRSRRGSRREDVGGHEGLRGRETLGALQPLIRQQVVHPQPFPRIHGEETLGTTPGAYYSPALETSRVSTQISGIPVPSTSCLASSDTFCHASALKLKTPPLMRAIMSAALSSRDRALNGARPDNIVY